MTIPTMKWFQFKKKRRHRPPKLVQINNRRYIIHQKQKINWQIKSINKFKINQ